MIELIGHRVLDVLKSYLPEHLTSMSEYWRAFDMAKFSRQIILRPPRNESLRNCSYYFGMPSKIPEYPAIVAAPLGSNFSGNSTSKFGFQSEDVSFKITCFYREALTELNEYVERGVLRYTDCVINTLREHSNLAHSDVFGMYANPSVKMVVSGYDCSGSLDVKTFSFRWAEFAVTYTTHDSVRFAYMNK